MIIIMRVIFDGRHVWFLYKEIVVLSSFDIIYGLGVQLIL